MSVTNVESRDVAWAYKLFRPLLKELKLQEKKDAPKITHTSAFKIFHRYNMTNSVIVVSCKKLRNKSDKGVFIWQYDKDNDFYALHIVLNEDLFENEDSETRIKRKLTGIHEFTHCVAAMMVFCRLKSIALIETLHNRMQEKFHSLDETSLESLISELSMEYTPGEPEHTPVFDDAHFRFDMEDFKGEYDELVKNFLLSYELFTEEPFFTQDKVIQFQKFMKSGNENDAAKLLVSVIPELATKKALSIRFIIRRINEEFLPKLRGKK